jgi:hypothetical protein
MQIVATNFCQWPRHWHKECFITQITFDVKWTGTADYSHCRYKLFPHANRAFVSLNSISARLSESDQFLSALPSNSSVTDQGNNIEVNPIDVQAPSPFYPDFRKSLGYSELANRTLLLAKLEAGLIIGNER